MIRYVKLRQDENDENSADSHLNSPEIAVPGGAEGVAPVAMVET